MDTNTKHLLRQWGIAVFFVGLTSFGLIAAIRRGDYAIPVVVAVVVVFILLQRWNAKRKVVRFFRDGVPDRAVAYYRSTMSRGPNGAPLTAYMCALTFSFYGEFDKARDELAKVSWASFPPLYDGFRTYVLSIIALLEKRDFPKALDLALEARDLCGVSAPLPGAATSRRSLDAHVLACELLAGRKDGDEVAALESALKDVPGTAPVIPAWALAQYYMRVGRTEAADAHIAIVRRLMPNCKPLALPNLSA